jgi:hypothetical protein
MPSRIRRCLVLLALPVIVAGCGSSGGGKSDTATLLKDTFSGGTAVKSGKLDVALGLQTQGLKSLTGPIALQLSGPFASQGAGKLPKFDFNLVLAAGGQTINAGAVSLGDSGYLKFGGQAYSVGQALFDQFKTGYEKSQTASKSKDAGPSFKALGVNPARWLTNAHTVGKEDVGGTSTYHITAGVDVPKFLADVKILLGKAKSLGGTSTQNVPTSLSPQVQSTIERSVKNATVDVYTGSDDHALRRLKLTVSLAVPKDAQKNAAGLKSGDLRFDLTIADLNKDQTIGAPANARPLTDLQQALGALQGTGTAGTSTTPQTTTPAAPASSAPTGAPAKYLQCVQQAGTDVAKVQQCAALVNGG